MGGRCAGCWGAYGCGCGTRCCGCCGAGRCCGTPGWRGGCWGNDGPGCDADAPGCGWMRWMAGARWIEPGERPPTCDGAGIGARTLGRRGASCMIIVWSSLSAPSRGAGLAARWAPSREAGAAAPPRADGDGATGAPPRVDGPGAGAPRAEGAGTPRVEGAGPAPRAAGTGAAPPRDGAPAAGRGGGKPPRRAGGSSEGRAWTCVGSSSAALGRRGRGSPFRSPPPPSFRFMCAQECTGPDRRVQSMVSRSWPRARVSPR